MLIFPGCFEPTVCNAFERFRMCHSSFSLGDVPELFLSLFVGGPVSDTAASPAYGACGKDGQGRGPPPWIKKPLPLDPESFARIVSVESIYQNTVARIPFFPFSPFSLFFV